MSDSAPDWSVGSPKVFLSVESFTKARESEPISRKFAPPGGSGAVVSLMRGMASSLRSMT